MPKSRSEKQVTITALANRFGRMTTAVFTAFSGLTVGQATELRKRLRDAGVDYVVAKKTLLRLALDRAKVGEVPLDGFTGSIGVAFGYEDEIAPAKLLYAFAKEYPVLTFRGAIVNGSFISAEDVHATAILPSRDEILAQVVASIASPLRGLVTVLGGNIRGLVTALTRLSERNST